MAKEATQPAPIIRTITAIPCGTIKGQPITRRYTYELTREPQVFGEHDGRTTVGLTGRCAASARHGLHREGPLAVVWEDSIQEI